VPVIVPLRPGPTIGSDGTVQPEAEAEPVKQTPNDAHVVAGDLVEPVGGGPAPNLPAIALELGRMEEKLRILLERPSGGGGGSCQFLDRTDEVLEVIESLQVDVDELSGRPERKLGPLAVTSEAPADFNADGSRASFSIDIPRLPATEFETLFLQRLLELLHWQKSCRNHVAKKATEGDPVTIHWSEIPYSE
jgi:hypothetical protein